MMTLLTYEDEADESDGDGDGDGDGEGDSDGDGDSDEHMASDERLLEEGMCKLLLVVLSTLALLPLVMVGGG